MQRVVHPDPRGAGHMLTMAAPTARSSLVRTASLWTWATRSGAKKPV